MFGINSKNLMFYCYFFLIVKKNCLKNVFKIKIRNFKLHLRIDLNYFKIINKM